MRREVRSATRNGEPVRSRTKRLIASSSSQRSTPARPPLNQRRRKLSSLSRLRSALDWAIAAGPSSADIAARCLASHAGYKAAPERAK